MDERFMREALRQARKAARLGEMPVGAVVVRGGEIISRGYNKREMKMNALLHAEIIAIERACKKLGNWRLSGCELYVTLEPCPMCAGAILNSRLDKVYYGAFDAKSGCASSRTNLLGMNLCNHYLESEGGILEDQCSAIIKDFFRKLRKEFMVKQ